VTARAPWSVADLLARHPWPEEHAGARRLEWLWHFDLPLAPDALWPVVADTSRLNRALGVAEMRFQPDQGHMRGTSRAGGRRHEWTEVPWNWVAGQWLESVRLYDKGYARVVYGVFALEPHDGGSRFYVYFGAVPRGAVGAAALRLGFGSLGKAYRKILPDVVAAVDAMKPSVLQLAPPALDAAAEARLTAIGERLRGRGLDGDCVERLIDWVRTGDEVDLFRIQVRERARAWGVDEDALLRVALHATRDGLLELSWDVVCPHCRGVAGASPKLGDLPSEGGCHVCGIDFATDTTEAVEITFHVHPSIRAIARRTFCSAEPAMKDHVRVQLAVPPGGEVEVAPHLPPGRYRMRIEGEKRYGYLDVEPGEGETRTWRASDPPGELAVAGAPTLRLVNDASEPRTFVVEASQWTDVALRPGRLLSFQDFRDLYDQEYLGADVQLAIGEQTILFTDMVGSTAMYATRGDPAAFVEVRRHFVDVFALIAEHRGAVVKTIGDAAMGAFNDPLDAVKAAAAIQRAFPPARADSPARLRISLNTGPCIAVRLNTDIDYFGHTVNVAAKLQALAEAWQIAMSQATLAAPGVEAWLEAEGAALEPCCYRSEAIPEGVDARRWTVFAAPAEPDAPA